MKKAYDEAVSQGLSPTYYVHSHPHPRAFATGNAIQIPSSPHDYHTAAKLRVNGILVVRDAIIFFNAGGARATVPVSSFIVD